VPTYDRAIGHDGSPGLPQLPAKVHVFTLFVGAAAVNVGFGELEPRIGELVKGGHADQGAAEIVDDSVGISELNPAYIQGYTVTATDAAGSVTMTWPTAFASAFYVVAATAKVSGNTTANVVVSAQTTTTVTFGWSGGPSGSWTIQAIGIHL